MSAGGKRRHSQDIPGFVKSLEAIDVSAPLLSNIFVEDTCILEQQKHFATLNSLTQTFRKNLHY